MKPASDDKPRSRRRGGMSNRQIKRRKGICETNFMNASKGGYNHQPLKSENDRLLTFGKASAVYANNGGLLIDINKKDLPTISPSEIQHALEIAKTPIPNFVKGLSQGKVNNELAFTRMAHHKMLHIGIWMNNVNHYSGGRVHLTLMAYALAIMGHKVTIVTDKLPRFLDDLKYIDIGDRIEFVHGDKMWQTNWLLNEKANNMDIVIATPRIYEAFYYADKWNLPCYAFLLETPNYVAQSRGGQDSTETYWAEYKNCILKHADFILCNPGPTLDAAKEWIPDFKGTFFECPPMINTYAADKVSAEEQNEICFVGRHLDFKCPDDVVKAVGQLPADQRPIINFIGSHNDQVRARILNKARPLDVEIKFYAGINDYEKFYIIKRSMMLIIPTKFEGFGMPPAEALYCEKPVIAYDIPILRHVYGDSLIYVKKGDIKGIANKIKELVKSPEKRLQIGSQGYLDMFSEDNNIPCIPFKNKRILRNIFYGKREAEKAKITVGIIAVNAADTLRLCLDSIYDIAEKIVIVEGAVEDFAKQNDKLLSGRLEGQNTFVDSIDGTEELVQEYIDMQDPLGKIVFIEPPKGRYWKNKNEMQNEIANRIETDLYLKVDADEIWKESDVEYCRRVFMLDPKLTTMYMRRWHFWKNLKTVAVGGQWDSAEARMWRWRKDFHHTMSDKKGFNYFVDENDNAVTSPHYKTVKVLERMHYHLGYCRNEDQIRCKIRYYSKRGIENNVKDNYTNWKQGQPTNSTHPNNTTAIPFTGKLPIVLTKVNSQLEKVNPKECVQNNVGMLNARGRDK